MHVERILKSLELRKKKPYTPAFHIVREQQGWRIFDRKTPIAFAMSCGAFDIWSFSPFEPAEIANPEPPGKVWDLHTLHNSFVNLAAHGWPTSWRQQAAESATCIRWTWRRKSGRDLLLDVTGSFADGERIRWTITLRYDPAWGRYRWTFDVAARKLGPEGFEMLNMMMAGALASRPEQRRWTHSIWEDLHGGIQRFVHSNALFSATDYAPANWRTRNGLAQGGWIGYAAHRSCNPAMIIHDTNLPIRFATCSQLFDEHILWSDAGHDDLGRDGYFQYRISAEFVNMPPKLARQLLAEGKDPVRPARWRYEAVALPLFMDRINSFEKTVNPWKAEECPILVIPKGNADVSWATDAAHTGQRSIRFHAARMHERRELFPTGAVCNVRPHHRYRLSGWIKTRGVDRLARLELRSYEYTYNNVIDSAQSADVNGTRNWTRVAVELDSGDEAYLMPKLILYGPGTAWFDDVLLEEIARK